MLVNGTQLADVIPWASYQIRELAGLRMRRKCRERFPRHRELAIPTCMRDVRAAMHARIAN